MSDSDNKDLHIQLEDNEKSFYSDDQMVITSKRLIVNGVTTSMQAVKTVWIGVDKIAMWPGVLLFLLALYLFNVTEENMIYTLQNNPGESSRMLVSFIVKLLNFKYLIIVLGVGYFFLRQKIAKCGVYVSGLNSNSEDSDETAIALSKDTEHLNTIMEAINKAIATK